MSGPEEQPPGTGEAHVAFRDLLSRLPSVAAAGPGQLKTGAFVGQVSSPIPGVWSKTLDSWAVGKEA